MSASVSPAPMASLSVRSAYSRASSWRSAAERRAIEEEADSRSASEPAKQSVKISLATAVAPSE
eukprot:6192280-Pleurochrysis_carterae.AAC.1